MSDADTPVLWRATRKNELRLLQVSKDFDLTRGTVLIHGKGDKVAVMPIGFQDLKDDLHLHLIDRQPDEYLIYPKQDMSRPMDPASMHRWFKRCLEQAGLPATIKIHELRHSAADNLYRATGNAVLAQQLLRHGCRACPTVALRSGRAASPASAAAVR